MESIYRQMYKQEKTNKNAKLKLLNWCVYKYPVPKIILLNFILLLAFFPFLPFTFLSEYLAL